MELSHFISLPTNWIAQYYEEIEASLFQDIHGLIHKDTKKLTLCNESFYFSQIEVWNAQALIKHYNFFKLMLDFFPESSWLLNLISIEEGHNYIFTNSENLENILGQIFTCKKGVSYLKTEELWMRKEIIKEIKRLPSISTSTSAEA